MENETNIKSCLNFKEKNNLKNGTLKLKQNEKLNLVWYFRKMNQVENETPLKSFN
jgi:hypothetical protein